MSDLSRKPYRSLSFALLVLVVVAFVLYLSGQAPQTAAKPAKMVMEKVPVTQPPAIATSERHVASKSLAPQKNSVLIPVAAPAEAAPLVVPPGAQVHTIAKGETVPGLLRYYLPETKYMTLSEFDTALHAENPNLKGLFPKPGTQIIIPGIEPQPIVEKSVRVPRDFEAKAIYLTGAMAGSENGIRIIKRWHDAGGNSVVFDIKDSDGLLSIHFDNPLAPQSKYVPLRNLPKFTRFVHSLGMHAIARIAIFRDEYLVTHHTNLAVKSRKTGDPWKENGKLVWTDPSHKEVQDYNIALAKYAADSGADEVQFDYVRFPAEGDQKDAKFSYQTEHPNWQRTDVIADFLQRAHAALQPKGVLFSLDVFGVMAWARPVDLSHTGQDIVRMAKNCDVLSPMIYPSHFFGMDGYAMPGDAPEHFIGESMEKFEKITAGSGVVLRPWLQAFGWKTKTYSVDYILTQVRVSNEKGGIGFLFWNARNDYAKPFGAMPVMEAAKAKYFHVYKPMEVSLKQAQGGE